MPRINNLINAPKRGHTDEQLTNVTKCTPRFLYFLKLVENYFRK